MADRAGSRTGGAPGRPAELRRELVAVRRRLRDAERRVPLAAFGESRESARNLLHYLALRQFDLRVVQDELAELGLSSLGRAESHVLFNLDAVLARLAGTGRGAGRPPERSDRLDPARGRRLVARNASRLFGRPSPGRSTRIMVTLPVEAAHDAGFARSLVAAGVDCFRINCAHDAPADWERMVLHVRRAARALHRRCPIEMDLEGPHVRTGPIAPGPAVLKVRPERDATGRLLAPATVWLVARGAPADAVPPGEPRLPVPAEWLARRRRGELLHLRDARGARRVLRVAARAEGAVRASLSKTAYFVNGLALAGRAVRGRPDATVLAELAARPGRIRLARGDRLRLVPGPAPGRDRSAPRGRRGSPARVGVTLPAALAAVRPGQRVWFDGGRLGGIVRSAGRSGVLVRIDRAPPGGAWLRSDQGINFPDSELDLPSLTEEDRGRLAFVVRHADLVGSSFVQSAEDVDRLRAELRRLGRPRMGVVLKIETRRGFDRLPEILLAALRSGPSAVMLARGDLAAEVGFERLAEVQEEILWLSEAAHLPAIWATQVLEGLAKSGIPTRAEVTDAAMGERAECVMLNKGPYLVEAVQALDSILRRMQAHQAKKSARLRHLAVAERFLARAAGPADGGLTP